MCNTRCWMIAIDGHLIKLAVLVALLELALDVVGQLLGLLARLLLILGRGRGGSRRAGLLLQAGLHAVVLRVVLLERRRVHLNDCALHQRLRPHLHSGRATRLLMRPRVEEKRTAPRTSVLNSIGARRASKQTRLLHGCPGGLGLDPAIIYMISSISTGVKRIFSLGQDQAVTIRLELRLVTYQLVVGRIVDNIQNTSLPGDSLQSGLVLSATGGIHMHF